jgi:hypothetical protein
MRSPLVANCCSKAPRLTTPATGNGGGFFVPQKFTVKFTLFTFSRGKKREFVKDWTGATFPYLSLVSRIEEF